jgi:hypothetical protein
VGVRGAPGTCQLVPVRPSGDPVVSHNGPALSNCVHAQLKQTRTSADEPSVFLPIFRPTRLR